jgi:hypothetical protein
VSNRLSRSAALVAALALAAVASPVAAADNAMVRVLHGSADAPAVDIYVNDKKVGAPLEGLEFKDLSPYVSLPAASYDIKVCASADAAVCPIDLTGVPVDAGKKYTIAAVGLLADSTITHQLIEDKPSPKKGEAEVRVVHFSPDTPSVDVLFQDGTPTGIAGLEYPNTTAYVPLPPDTYDLKVCASADNSLCPLDLDPLPLESGKSYSVFAIGSLAGDSLTYAAGVDATASIPAPETDTVGATTTSTTSQGLPLLLLAAGIAAFAGALRLATSRTRR